MYIYGDNSKDTIYTPTGSPARRRPKVLKICTASLVKVLRNPKGNLDAV